MTVTHARRREHLAALLPAHEADAILVTHGVNVRYLTGLASSNAAVLRPGRRHRDAGHRLPLRRDRRADLLRHRGDRGARRRRAPGSGRRQARRRGRPPVASPTTSGWARACCGSARRMVEAAARWSRTRPRSSSSAPRARSPTGRSPTCCRIIGPGLTETRDRRGAGRAGWSSWAPRGPPSTRSWPSGPNGAIPHHAPGRPAAASAATWSRWTSARCTSGYHADMTRTVAVGEPAQLAARDLRAGRGGAAGRRRARAGRGATSRTWTRPPAT